MTYEHATTGVIVKTDMAEVTGEKAPEAPPVNAHPPQLLLPRNLAALAKLCAKDSARYALTGIRLERTPEGYRACATDGKALAMVDGPNAAPPEEYPPLPALASAPNGATESIILAKYWADAFKAIPKMRYAKPALQALAVVMNENLTTLASTNLEQDNVTTPRNVEGRFPRVEDCIPDLRTLVASMNVDAGKLADLLNVAKEYAGGESLNSVTIELHKGDGKPMKLTAKNPDGQRFIGLLMPLTGDKPKASRHPAQKDIGAILRTCCRLLAVWAAHNKAYLTCPGNARDAHRDIMQRCQKAHSALTAKYLS